MAQLEDMNDRLRRQSDQIMNTPLSKEFRYEEDETKERDERYAKITRNQLDWLLREVHHTGETLINHMSESDEIRKTVINVDKMMTALIDPTIGLIPKMDRNVEATREEITMVKQEVKQLNKDIHNGISDSILELRQRLSGCEDGIVGLREEEVREEGEESGSKKVVAFHNRRRDDKYKTLALLVSIPASILSVVTIIVTFVL